MPPKYLKPGFRILDLEKVRLGWRWKVAFRYRGQELINHYCTNMEGRGLWASPHPDEKYSLKKCDEFSLPPNRQGALTKITLFFLEREVAARAAQEAAKPVTSPSAPLYPPTEGIQNEKPGTDSPRANLSSGDGQTPASDPRPGPDLGAV